jgi:hypothetical protein
MVGREMNANELADYMDNNVEAMLMSEQKYIDEAARLLRVQQSEIAQLKVAYEQEQYRSKQWQERFESGRLT